MTRRRNIPALRWLTLALLLSCALAGVASAQGVTTGNISGVVTDTGNPVAGASVIAIHEPSGTSYETTTRADGRFSIPNMRVGGPYTLQVVYVGAGNAFEPHTQENVTVNLGVSTDLALSVRAITVTETVTVTAETDPVFASSRTGAATQVSRDEIANLPSISGRIDSVTRLTPQAGGSNSFGGQDGRMNNITVDGSYFNNSFGIGNSPGDRTGVAPISLQAIEQIQVSIAPFDVRQGSFIGASVNTVTRSGTNQLRGSAYRQFRSDSMVGTKAKDQAFNPGTFNFGMNGGWASGPIVKNRLFYFANFENEAKTEPGTTFTANTGGQTAAGNTTRVQATDLNTLSAFLQSKFNYETGAYQGYNHEIPAKRFLPKFDYNINNANKITFRYLHLTSSTDVLLSNSTSLGIGGTRRTSVNALNFQNSNYQIMENIRSGIGEWNSVVGRNMSNTFIGGYTYNDESRNSRGELFPFVDILDGSGAVYTSFGFEPFTPNNELRYKTLQMKDDFTRFGEKHSLTFGASFEKYHSDNVFFSGKQSVYVYNTLADFYTDANDYLANPGRTTSPVTLRRFQVRYMNLPGMEKPLQPLDVIYAGAYAQDEWQPAGNVKVTAGVRADVAKFGDNGFTNPNADGLTFRDEDGKAVQYSSGKLPDPKILWSPRIGFNWDVDGGHNMQVRGGTGIFTGKPAYVWISNQIGQTGVLTGFTSADNTTAFPFNPDPDFYKPKTTPTGAPAASYELNVTDPEFKFPQIWRTNIAVDRKLMGGWTGTGEFIYNKDIDGPYYINANLPAAQSAYTGVDPRPRWVGTSCAAATATPCVTRLNNVSGNQVTSNFVIKNQSVGKSWNAAGSLSKSFRSGIFVKGAYSFGEAKNTVDPGSTASSSWGTNPHPGDPNNPGIGFSGQSSAHRVFATASYSKQWLSVGTTTISTFWEAKTIGNASYVFSGDANGDTSNNNDLIYIPKDASEMNFADIAATSTVRAFSVAEQIAAWDAFISQDNYLSKHRGEYAKRNAVFLPFVRRMDLSVSQDLFKNIGGQRNAFQLRVDVINVGNLVNKNWGVSQRLIGSSAFSPFVTQPLTFVGADANGALQYRLRVINGALISKSLEQTASESDVYRLMVTLKYLFN